MRHKSIDISDELIIQPYANGIRLVRPESLKFIQHNFCTVSRMLNMPFNVYFKSADKLSVNIKVNEPTAMSVGADSSVDFIGKTAGEYVTPESLVPLIQHDQRVLSNRTMIIQEANFHRIKDHMLIQTVAIKFPWYGLYNEIIGIFGCSIRVDLNNPGSLAHAITQLSEAGLLSCNKPSNAPIEMTEKYYLTQREKDVIYQLIQGKTAKQVAKALDLSHRTVETYIESLKIKMKVSSKSALVEKIFDIFAQHTHS